MYIPVLNSALKGNSPVATESVRPVGNSEPATPQAPSLNRTRIAPSRMKGLIYLIGIFLILVTSGFASVNVSSPGNGWTVGSPVHYVATGYTSTCSKGVSSMGVYVDNQLVKVVNGASLNTSISIGS